MGETSDKMAEKPDGSPTVGDRQPASSRQGRLLAWYDRHARRLPWRVLPDPSGRAARADPYRVWLSEIMLQQTTVATVGPYFTRFTARWPAVADLAAAPLDEVLTAWAGLGYYARAHNLHRCARVVAEDLGGRFPDRLEELAKLPGIGPYTAAAIAAIAFDRPAPVVDGNVERVVARLFAIEDPLPGAKAEIRRRTAALTPTRRPGDFAQAMMDLGATLCLPGKPNCLICPLAEGCRARAKGNASSLPRKAPKKPRPTRHAIAFLLLDQKGALLLRRRPEKGLLGGMMEVPSTTWGETPPTPADARQAAPLARARLARAWRPLPGKVVHVFTHFRLETAVWAARLGPAAPGEVADLAGRWVLPDALGEEALPTVMKKIISHGLRVGS